MDRQRLLRFRPDEPVANSMDNPFAHVGPYTHRQHRFKEFSDFEVESQAGIDPTDATAGDLFQLHQHSQTIPILSQDNPLPGPSRSQRRSTSPTQDKPPPPPPSPSMSPINHPTQLPGPSASRQRSISPAQDSQPSRPSSFSMSPFQSHTRLPRSPQSDAFSEEQTTPTDWVDTELPLVDDEDVEEDDDDDNSNDDPPPAPHSSEEFDASDSPRLEDESSSILLYPSSSRGPVATPYSMEHTSRAESNHPKQLGGHPSPTEERTLRRRQKLRHRSGTINEESTRAANMAERPPMLQISSKETCPFLSFTCPSAKGSATTGETIPYLDLRALQAQKAASNFRPTRDPIRSPPHKRFKHSTDEPGPQAGGSTSQQRSGTRRAGQLFTPRPLDVYNVLCVGSSEYPQDL